MYASDNTSRNTQRPIRWDAYGCPPFKINSDLLFLSRYKKSGINFISLNVGFDLTTQAESIELLKYFHRWIHAHGDEYAIALNTKQILENQLNNKLSIAFDIEGCNLLNDDIHGL